MQASLPVTVNVQDLFRGERLLQEHSGHVPYSYMFFRLFSRFTISATEQQYIRVSSATLESEKDEQGLSIFGTLSQAREVTVRPQEHGNVDVTHVLLDHHPCASRTFFV